MTCTTQVIWTLSFLVLDGEFVRYWERCELEPGSVEFSGLTSMKRQGQSPALVQTPEKREENVLKSLIRFVNRSSQCRHFYFILKHHSLWSVSILLGRLVQFCHPNTGKLKQEDSEFKACWDTDLRFWLLKAIRKKEKKKRFTDIAYWWVAVTVPCEHGRDFSVLHSEMVSPFVPLSILIF